MTKTHIPFGIDDGNAAMDGTKAAMIAGNDEAEGTSVTVENLVMEFGSVTAVDRVSLDIAAGEFLALLGPSGSGKSTVLMGIAGFEAPTSGRILIGGEDITRVPPHRRNIGMVFQNYTLFPHMSVAENVAFPLKMRGVRKAERLRAAEEALAVVRLEGYGARMPSQLSGGQQQRVALARAIVYKPRVLLMDEPLSALDKNLRENMQLEIKRLHAELDLTIIFVTHDQGEALTMADRVAVLRQGQIQQVDTARTLYENPTNLFSAGFVGEMNFFDAEKRGERIELTAGPECRHDGTALPDGKVVVAIRPERLSLQPNEDALRLDVTLRDIVYAGAGTLLIGALPEGTEIRARVASAGSEEFREGEAVTLWAPKKALRIFAETPE